jgi:hypothetical protein
LKSAHFYHLVNADRKIRVQLACFKRVSRWRTIS